MATPAWVPLATTTLSSSASSVTFGSIPSGYKDLQLVMTPLGNQVQDVATSFNGSSANFTGVRMWGYSGNTYGSNTYSTSAGMTIITTSPPGTVIWNIMDYSATDKHKTILVRGGTQQSYDFVWASAYRWASTSAITSITMSPTSPYVYVAGATFSLWGRNAL